MVYGIGINDMPYGWRSESEYNYRIYRVWHSMIQRCYSEKLHEKYSTYKNCYCCERWLTLSNFVEDICNIDGYEYWLQGFNKKRNPYELDKDIKSNGQNKCYCLEECMFVNYAENARQATKDKTGENHPNHGELVAQIDPITNKILNLKYNRGYIELGFTYSSISACCRGKRKTHNR